ncbi:MAG: hypothetical protein LBP62_04265 [Clostridiales bacterium]|jgi:spore germination protein KC|nr:hypothetical protein [Clostridiales bacterium]
MKNLVKKKGIILFILLSLFVVLSANIKNVDLNKRALVIGMGVDFSEDGYELTIQTYLAKQVSDSSPEAGEALTVSARGITLGEAAKRLNIKTGKTLSFALCYVVIFGAEAAERGVLDALNFIMNETDAAWDAALLYGEISAKEIMKIKSPINTGSMLLLHDMLSDKQSKPYDTKTVKDFYADCFSRSGASSMPVLKKTAGGQDAESAGSEDDKEKKEYYEISSAAVFKRDKFLFETDADETFAMGLLSRGRARGTFGTDFGRGRASFITDRKKLHEKYNISDMLYTAEIKVFLEASVSEKESVINAGKDAFGPNGGASRITLTKEEIAAAEQKIERDISAFIEKSAEYGADVLALNDKFFQRFGRKWEEAAGSDYLNRISKKIKVRAEIV